MVNGKHHLCTLDVVFHTKFEVNKTQNIKLWTRYWSCRKLTNFKFTKGKENVRKKSWNLFFFKNLSQFNVCKMTIRVLLPAGVTMRTNGTRSTKTSSASRATSTRLQATTTVRPAGSTLVWLHGALVDLF